MQLRPILAALAAISAGGATAQTMSAPTAVAVRYADLDLSSPAGIARLDRLLLSAAQAVCGPVSAADPKGDNRARHCRKQALFQARAQRNAVLASLEKAQGSAGQFAARR